MKAQLKRRSISRAWGGGLSKLCRGGSDGLFPATELEHVDPVVDDSVEAGAGVNKRRRACEPAAVVLVPPSLNGWLPQNHLSRFIADIVETQLDLSKFYASYAKTKGQPPYDPRFGGLPIERSESI